MTLIPEIPFDIEQVCGWVEGRYASGHAPIVVVAEGAVPAAGSMSVRDGETDAFGHVRLAGIGEALADEIESRTGHETRAVVFGHVQRGGTPTAYDRWLATRFGLAAVSAVHDRRFGTMVALRGTDVIAVPLAEATGELKTVSAAQYAELATFFG